MHRSDKFWSKGKIVREFTADVAKIVTVNDFTHSRQILQFTHPVVELWETETTSELKLRSGETLKSGATHNDFYGYFTSPQEVLLSESARGYQPGGEVFSEVYLKLMKRFVVSVEPDPRPFMTSIRPEYRYLPNDWIILDGQNHTIEALQKWIVSSFEERVEMPEIRRGGWQECEPILLWTSDNTFAENRDRFAEVCGMLFDTSTEIERQIAQYDKEMLTPSMG